MDREYLLGNKPELSGEHLDYLRILLDSQTIGVLDTIGVKPEWRCLDVGAGAGSIARWLAERTGPGGTVVAADLDTDQFVAPADVEVHRHDINEGVPPGGPFDLIHTRLLLMHLTRRVAILDTLVDALAPGGWLVVGDYTGPQHLVSAPSEADEELFHRVQLLGINALARDGRGVSLEWAREVDGHMLRAGLTNVESIEYHHTTSGGTAGCLLSSNLITQVEAPLRAAGITGDELRRYHELMLDPRFRAWFLPFVCTRGQKPTT